MWTRSAVTEKGVGQASVPGSSLSGSYATNRGLRREKVYGCCERVPVPPLGRIVEESAANRVAAALALRCQGDAVAQRQDLVFTTTILGVLPPSRLECASGRGRCPEVHQLERPFAHHVGLRL